MFTRFCKITFLAIFLAACTTPTSQSVERKEGIFTGQSYNTVRFYIDSNFEHELQALGLNKTLYKQIINAAKARNGGSLPGRKQYFIALTKDRELWAMEFGKPGEYYRVFTDRHDGKLSTYKSDGTPLTGSTKSSSNRRRWPINYRKITSEFNPRRRNPVTGYVRPHNGIDLAAAIGTPIYAPAGGKVTVRERQSGYGKVLKINHGNGYATFYAHLNGYAAGTTRGSHVHEGQKIGYVGNTGRTTGPHLHYEVHVNGKPRNPRDYRVPSSGSGGGARTLSGSSLARFKANQEKQLAALRAEEAKFIK